MYVIIGGSGFYDFLTDAEYREISTPFGTIDVEMGAIEKTEVAFLPRHGKRHSIAPSSINYRGNIYAAYLLNADAILTTNAVGSLRDEIPPGTLIVPDQILDYTSGRESTFFDGGDLEVTSRSGKILKGVIHTDVSAPYDPDLRSLYLSIGENIGLAIKDGATMVVYNGPRYETPAEIKAAKILGGDLAGMTSAPEAFLAKELEIPYATIAVATNFAAGMQSRITHEEVDLMFSKKISDIKSLFTAVITTQD